MTPPVGQGTPSPSPWLYAFWGLPSPAGTETCTHWLERASCPCDLGPCAFWGTAVPHRCPECTHQLDRASHPSSPWPRVVGGLPSPVGAPKCALADWTEHLVPPARDPAPFGGYHPLQALQSIQPPPGQDSQPPVRGPTLVGGYHPPLAPRNVRPAASQGIPFLQPVTPRLLGATILR